jgi:hypothetical protein
MVKKLLGARIPETLVLELREYCKSHGILMNHFVSEAIKKETKKKQKQKNYQ